MADDPAWMALARRELGVREEPGPAHNARILSFFRDAGHGEVRNDETAWCAAFVGACLERAGMRSTRSLMARSYLTWGEPIQHPRPGCIVVLKRGLDPRSGHTGFYAGEDAGGIQVLGGNQSDSVRITTYARSRLLGYRWPHGAAAEQSIFERALDHVLAMEGGWSKDPADPGGATNHGITLAVYARHKGILLTKSTMATLEAELRAVSPDTVRVIYRDRYWLPARCDLLPAGPALMHFDAAVNHGPGRATRMLQEAAGARIDGAIGPETLAAVHAADPMQLVSRYAELRRAAYRRLPIFARFGRGWLRRVDATLKSARALAGEPELPMSSSPRKETTMTTNQPKWWAHSLTVWGTLITALSTVLPIIGPFIGLDVSGAIIVSFGEQVTHILQALGGLIGTLMAIAGRIRASAPLQQNLLTFRI